MIYLSSPYTHPDPAVLEARWREACRAASNLNKRGKYCYCPIAETHGQAALFGVPLDWPGWIERDMWFLTRCDELYILCIDGWRESVGIKHEVAQWGARMYSDALRWMVPTWRACGYAEMMRWMVPTADGYEIRETEPGT